MSRRRVVVALWALAAAIAIGLVLGVAGLWGHKSTSNTVVARYIKSVDSVQQQMRLPLTQLLTVYRGFSTRNATPEAQAKLAGAVQTLRLLESRLSAIDAPPTAAKLRRLLVQLVQAEVGVAHEVLELGRFMPRFRAAVGLATVANRQLSRALKAAAPPKPHVIRGTKKQIAKARAAYQAQATAAAAAQADAVDAYDRVLGVVLGALKTLKPPPVMAPAFSTQVQTLEATQTAGSALAQELRKTNRKGVPKLSRRFTLAARLSGSVAAQRAEIAAVKGYNARVRRIGTLQGRIQAEVNRLQRTLG